MAVGGELLVVQEGPGALHCNRQQGLVFGSVHGWQLLLEKAAGFFFFKLLWQQFSGLC